MDLDRRTSDDRRPLRGRGPWLKRSLGLLGACVVAVATAGIPGQSGDATPDRVLGQGDFNHNTVNLVDGRGFSSPRAIAFDRSVNPNRVYVADTNNNRVLAWSDVVAWTSGAPAEIAIGQPDVLTNNACNQNGVTATNLCTPGGVAVDPAGNLYVADTGNSRVLEFDVPFATDGIPDRVFGQSSLAAGVCNSGGVSASSLCSPVGIAVDGFGNLYVADSQNSRVLEYEAPLDTDLVADRVWGQVSFTFNNCNPDGRTASSMCTPSSVALDASGNLYVADSGNNRVLEYDDAQGTDTVADRVFGKDSFTAGSCYQQGLSASTLCLPQGLALDAAGNLYVADEGNDRVLEYDAPLGDQTADRVFGESTFTANDNSHGDCTGTQVPHTLCRPFGVAVDASGNLYVADSTNNRVMEYDDPIQTDAVADHVLGQLDFNHNLENLVDGRGLYYPSSVAIDRSVTPNRLYVADESNSRVLVWNDVKAWTNGSSADEVIGEPDFSTRGCNRSGSPSAATLCLPEGVAVDGSGNLYVADSSNNRVLEYDDPLNTDFVADRVFGQGTFTTTTCNGGGASASTLCYPVRIAVDSSGNLYVADEENNRVLEYDSPLTGDEIADRVFGQDTFTAVNWYWNGPASASSLSSPYGLAVDDAGNLYVADRVNGRVLEYDNPVVSDQVADRVFGQDNFSDSYGNTDSGPNASTLAEPKDVALDRLGNLYVVDASNCRVLEYDDPLHGDHIADRVFGQTSFTTANCDRWSVSADSLYFPTGVAVDVSGNLYVAEYQNHRVLEYDFPLASPAAPKATDYGDAPAPYPTLSAQDGARHLLSNLYLGSAIDAESDGIADPNAAADGDDDGVTFGLLRTGNAASVRVVVTGGRSKLDAWIDFNRNGSWADAGERIFSGTTVYPGVNNLTFTVPANASVGDTFVRVRLSSRGVSAPTGLAPDGEVEDYKVSIAAAPYPVLATTPSTIAFAGQTIGTSSPAQTVTVKNTGDATLVVGTPSLTGANSGDFRISANHCTSGIAPSASCTIDVKFLPSASGGRGAALSIPSNAANSPATVSLMGTGTTRGVKLSNSSLSFGNAVVGSTSAPQSVIVTNTGTGTLTFGTFTTTGDFSISSNNCSGALAPSANCTVGLTFTPTDKGPRSGTFTVQSDAPSSPDQVVLSGTGLVQGADVTLNPISLSFGSQPVGTSRELPLTLSNFGTSALSIAAITAQSPTAPIVFSQVANCPSTLASGTSCSIRVAFNPALARTWNGALTIISNAASSPNQAALTGTGR